jgi:hypothetical protein
MGSLLYGLQATRIGPIWVKMSSAKNLHAHLISHQVARENRRLLELEPVSPYPEIVKERRFM